MNAFVMIVFLIVCILLIIVVLLQKGRGGGLGGIFGGGGHSAFGTRTGDVFTWVTIVLVGVFLLLAIGATKLFRGGELDKLGMPRFTPAPKAIDRPQSVTITCRPQEAEIFFTVGPIDNPPPDPTRASLKYDAPVRINPGQVLKAWAYLTGWKASDVRIGEYPAMTTTAPAPATTQAGTIPGR